MNAKTTKSKRAKKVSKRRLALPINLVSQLDEAKKNLLYVQAKGRKELEKLFDKVSDADLVHNLRNNDLIKKASQTTHDFSREFEKRARHFGENFRTYIPVPTRSEIDKLSRRVDQLSKKLDDLSASPS